MKIQKIKAIGTKGKDQPMELLEIERRSLLPNDVAFEVLYCGICHSDLHQIKDDFGHSNYPMVPGHEIVGRVVGVGPQVSKFKIGDLAAVGCIVDSCGHCQHCEHDLEMFCENGVTFSFNSADRISGGITYGGFSQTYVCNDKYVLKMPDFKDLAAAAPLLCAGITVYSPLKHWKAGPGKKVGILGIGGLGHLAIRIAKALGAEVTVLTRTLDKAQDATRLGADNAVITTDAEQMKAALGTLDIIIDTVSAKHDINAYLNLLRVDGSVVLVGLPPENLEVGAFNIIMGRKNFSGSNIGGIAETQEMLDFCYRHNIVADIELIKPEYVNKALERLEKNDVKYRFVIDMKALV